jgi:hypothetical protein
MRPVTSSLNLQAFKAEVARALGTDEFLQDIVEWPALLQYLARTAERHPGLVIVLDEFPYLAGADPALPSIIQSSGIRSGSMRRERGRLGRSLVTPETIVPALEIGS